MMAILQKIAINFWKREGVSAGVQFLSGNWLCIELFSARALFLRTTRQFSIAVVRRLFKMGLQMVERRWNTLRRLFHPLPAEMWSMLIYDDAYFQNVGFY